MELPMSNVLFPSLLISFTCTAAAYFVTLFYLHNLLEKEKKGSVLALLSPDEP